MWTFRALLDRFPALAEATRTLRDIPELGMVVLRDSHITLRVPPSSNVYTAERWGPTLAAVERLCGPACASRFPATFRALGCGEGVFFVCLYDGWREYSRFVPPSRRVRVPWSSLDAASRARYACRGSAGEPRFAHDRQRPEVYPELCCPVLAFGRHRGDASVVVLPDSHMLGSRCFEAMEREVLAADAAEEAKEAKEAAAAAAKAAHLLRSAFYWRSSPNFGRVVYGDASVRELVLRASALAPGEVDARLVRPGVDARLSLAAQIASGPLALDVDGMVGAWSGRVWKMLSRRVVCVSVGGAWEHWLDVGTAPGFSEALLPVVRVALAAETPTQDAHAATLDLLRQLRALRSSRPELFTPAHMRAQSEAMRAILAELRALLCA